MKSIVSILARQHDHPLLTVPAGEQRYGVHWKVCVGNLLASVLAPTAILVDHCCLARVDCHAHLDEPVICANLTKVARNGIHDPKTPTRLTQVVGAVCEHMLWGDSVIALSARELCEQCGIPCR